MLTKNKIGLALVLIRRNATPVFCALLPQVSHKTLRFFNEQSLTTFSQKEQVEESGFTDPPGIHLIPLPFADDIRAAPIQEAFRGMRYHYITSKSHFYSLS